MMNRIATFAVVIALAAVSASSRAAYEAYLIVQGSKQGQFKGEGKSKSNRIPVLSFSFGVQSPRDAHTGLATGQRQHEPLVVRLSSANSIEFQKAITNGELLPAVKVELVKPLGDGKVSQYETITLTNALVSKVSIVRSTGSNAIEAEEIQLTYQKMTVVQSPNKTIAEDAWMGKAPY